jgi:hypothetical protein
MAATLIGQGWLSWPRLERVSDRYGSVLLTEEDGVGTFELTPGLDGRRGQLVAKVTARGLSEHIGDLFRGLSPPRSVDELPALGSEHVLGEGAVFYHEMEGAQCIGVAPDDERDADWLDPHALYRLHEQEVELRLVEA